MSAQALPEAAVTRSGAGWTVDDWWALNEASHGERFELVDGGFLVSPAPDPKHQVAGDELRAILKPAAKPGFLPMTAAGVRLEGTTALIPDLVVVSLKEPIPSGPVPASAVLLVVEIVSPSSRLTDRRLKPGVYAAAGIPHFWRVEMLPFRDQGDDRLPVLFAYELNGDEYELVQRVGAGRTARFVTPFDVEFDPGDLYEPDLFDE